MDRVMPLLLTVSLLAGCAAGVTPQQRQTDAEITYGRQERKVLCDQRVEFDQLAEDFQLTGNPVFLDKMAGVLELTAKELAKARAFRDLEPPYHRGIALARHQAAEEAVRTGQQQRCEMLLILAEIHLRYGDAATGHALLARVGQEFPEPAFANYRAKADALVPLCPITQMNP
jgi:hypothetical protein